MIPLDNHHSVVIALALYSSLALALGLAASYVLRRHAARAFGVLWLAMVAALLLPFGTWTVRHFQWGLLVETQPTANLTSWDEPIQDSDTMVLPEPVANSNDDMAPALASPTPMKQDRPLPWRPILLIGWGLLSFALLVRLIIRWISMIRLLGQCTSPQSKPMGSLDHDIPAHLQPTKPIRLLSHPRLRTPAIWCWGRQLQLLLPATASAQTDWPSVFCHELAHAQRRDHIFGLISEIMICLLPWQPLLWWAKHRLSLLSEQACDDWVLASGRDGTDYAESLLNLLPQHQADFVPALASNRHGVAGRIERILKNQCSNPRPGWVWSLGMTLTAIILIAGIALAQTRPNANKNQRFSTPPFTPILQNPDESDGAFRARQLRVLTKRREIDLGQRPGESEAQWHQRQWDAAAQSIVIHLPQGSNETQEAYLARKAAKFAPMRDKINLVQEPNETNIEFVNRLGQAICALVSDREIAPETHQYPGESGPVFRARRARELAQWRLGLSLHTSLFSDPYITYVVQNPGESDAAFRARRARALARARILANRRVFQTLGQQQPGESEESFQLRLWEDTLKRAELIIPYEPGESQADYQAGKQAALADLLQQVNLTQEPNESGQDYRSRLVKEIRTAVPTAWLGPDPHQNPGEIDAAFRARRTKELTHWYLNLSLAQRPGESTEAHQQRLFESTVRAARIYIPYQSPETAHEYNVRRQKELEQLKAKLPSLPADNEDLAGFYARLVKQIQALIPTQLPATSSTIIQRRGESDAAFRARRARELARRRILSQRTSTTDQWKPITQRTGESDAAYRARRARELARRRIETNMTNRRFAHLPLASDPQAPSSGENSNTKTIKQRAGESDAAFRARRARELALRRILSQRNAKSTLATDPNASEH